MTYNITKTNGEQFMELEENSTETVIYNDATKGGGLVMIGKLVAEYGTDQSNNFLRLLENFANITAPDNPVLGMLWYNSAEKSLFVCTQVDGDIEWTKVLYIRNNKSDSAQQGDIYYDADNQEFYVYDEEHGWVLIGPFNYKHRIQSHLELMTYAGSETATQNFDIPVELLNDCSFLVTTKIIAREKYDATNTVSLDPNKKPSTAAWISTMLMERYKNVSTDAYDTILVGNENVQTIAKMGDVTDGWGFNITKSESGGLSIGVRGSNGLVNIPANENHIAWEIEMELLKV